MLRNGAFLSISYGTYYLFDTIPAFSINYGTCYQLNTIFHLNTMLPLNNEIQ